MLYAESFQSSKRRAQLWWRIRLEGMATVPERSSMRTRSILDATDIGIIHALQFDGRMPFVRVAELIGVSERTVRRKFYRLLEQGTL